MSYEGKLEYLDLAGLTRKITTLDQRQHFYYHRTKTHQLNTTINLIIRLGVSLERRQAEILHSVELLQRNQSNCTHQLGEINQNIEYLKNS